MRLPAVTACLAVVFAAGLAHAADGLEAEVQTKIDAQIKDIQAWASSPAIVDAVKQVNDKLSDDAKAMTQEKWKSLPLTDPFVRGFAKNATADFLRTKKSAVISEAFVSAADGTKVAFLAKTTAWSHKGKPKHDDPMAGKTWQGPVEIDESTGVRQVQVAVPVKDGDKVVGSLVVGLNISKLKD